MEALFRIGNQTSAYIEAYPDFEGTRRTASRHASIIMKRPIVMAEIARVKQEAAEKSLALIAKAIPDTQVVTLQGQIAKCQEGQRLALEERNMSAYSALVKLEAELAGLLVKKTEVVIKRVDELSMEEMREIADECEHLLREFRADTAAPAPREKRDGAAGIPGTPKN